MPTARQKGYTRKSRGKRQDPSRNQEILLTGRVGVTRGLYVIIDEALEKRNWNWTTLAKAVGYTRAHISAACRAPTMSMGIFMQVMAALGLRWQDHCTLEWPESHTRG